MKVKTSSWHYKLYVAVRRPWPFFQKTTRDIGGWTDWKMNIWIENIEKGHKWGFGQEDFVELPRPKNLCRYFWGTIFGFGILILQWVAIITLFIPVAIIAGIVFSAGYLKAKWKMKFPKKVKKYVESEEKEPGLFTSYLAARKQKVCPLITVIDDEE